MTNADAYREDVPIDPKAPVADTNAPLLEDVFLAAVMAVAFGGATHLFFDLPSPWGIIVSIIIGLVVGGFVTLMRENRRLRVDLSNGTFQMGRNKPYHLADVELIPGRVVGGKGVALFQFKIKTPGALINVASRRGAILRRRWEKHDIATLSMLVDAVGTPEFQKTWHENWVPTLRSQMKER